LETLEIEVNARQPGSKHQARRLRREGKIPAVLYGPKVQPLALELNRKDFSSRVAGLEGSHLVRMKSASTGLADKVALVKEMQYHPITGECLPLDIPQFFNVDVSGLDIGDSVHIEDLPMPEGVTAIYDSNFALVTVATPTVEEEPTAATAATPEAAAVASPEEKEKKEEE
jgi:large subunit ribosomal protein L25